MVISMVIIRIHIWDGSYVEHGAFELAEYHNMLRLLRSHCLPFNPEETKIDKLLDAMLQRKEVIILRAEIEVLLAVTAPVLNSCVNDFAHDQCSAELLDSVLKFYRCLIPRKELIVYKKKES
jgi:hypothetical protein